jgi:polyferredoxin
MCRFVWLLPMLLAPAGLRAESCYSDLGIVRDVRPEHLADQARAVIERLAEWGAPLDRWELDILQRAIATPRDAVSIGTIQQVLDAHVLISLSLSREGEIKAVPGPARALLPIDGRGVFLIKLDNLGQHISRLTIDSDQAIAPDSPGDADRWLRFHTRPDPPQLSGERVDYLLLRAESRQQGQREALFVFSLSGRPLPAPGPLTYNRVPILFTIAGEAESARIKLAHLLRHQHNQPYLAAPRRRGPVLATVRNPACVGCHDFALASQIPPRQLEREQSCVACHRDWAGSAASLESAPRPCPVCGMPDCQMGCVTRGRTQAGERVVLMAGVPRGLFLGAVAIVLVVSFGLVEFLGRAGRPPAARTPEEPAASAHPSLPSDGLMAPGDEPAIRGAKGDERAYAVAPPAARRDAWRWNVLSLTAVAWCVRQAWFRPLLQGSMFGLFCFLIYAGFAGDAVVNITPLLTWTIWWAGLIFLVLFLGKAWCFVCPWDFAATLAQGVSRLWGSPRPFTLGWRWPRAMRNIYLAIGLFILLTWLELGYRVTGSPRATAVLALRMVALSVIPALLFDRRSFCRYGCMIGRISGLYALFAPVEVRSADPAGCRDCHTRDCYRGNDAGPPCPTSLYLPVLHENTYCIQCGYCMRTCATGNVAFHVRPFAADLMRLTRPRSDEAVLAVILLALTFFHGLTMTPIWDSADRVSVVGWLRGALGVGPLAAFSVGMAGVLIVPALLYGLLCAATRWLMHDAAVSWRQVWLHFAYALVPVALFYHLAHNAMHLFSEGQYLLPLLSDPLGWGWDLFGTAPWRPGPLLAARTIGWVQVGLVIVGHVFGIVVAHRVARRLYGDSPRATLAQVPMLAGMVLFSWSSLWLLHLDMNMRSSLM